MSHIRELAPEESGVLYRILEELPSPIAAALAAQVPATKVSGGTPMLLDLVDDRSVGPAECLDGPVPVRAIVEGPTGEPEGEIIVWVTNGHLSGMEFAWYTDEIPAAMPSPDRLRIRTA